MTHFPHLALRGSTWWWRRALTVAVGRQVLVAFSLRTRDQKEAQRLCRRANVMADSAMMNSASPTAANLKAAIQGALFQTRLDTDDRLRENLREGAALDAEARVGFFGMLALAARRHAHLYDVAFAFGPITKFTDAVHAYLKIEGVPWIDIDWVADKIEKHYVADMYTSAGPMTGAPPEAYLADRLEEDGCEATAPAVSEAFRSHAAGRVVQERAAAEIFAVAKTDLPAAFARLAPEPPFTRLRDPAFPLPSWTGIDDIRRGRLEIDPSVHEKLRAERVAADQQTIQSSATACATKVCDKVRQKVSAPMPSAVDKADVTTQGRVGGAVAKALEPIKVSPTGHQTALTLSSLFGSAAISQSHPPTPWINVASTLTGLVQFGTRAGASSFVTYQPPSSKEDGSTGSRTAPLTDAPTERPSDRGVGEVATSVVALSTGTLGRVPAGAARPPIMRPPNRHGVTKPMALLPPLTKPTTLPEVVEALIEKKSKESTYKNGTKKAARWDTKTVEQHRSIAQFFAAVVGSYDLGAVRSEHIPIYFRVLEAMPKTLGRSSRAHAISLEEHLKAAAELDGEKLGRDTQTVNRHATQLGALLRKARSFGLQIDGLDEMLADERLPEEEPSKTPFTCDDIKAVLQHEKFVNTMGDVPPSLYWVTLLAIYTGARMSELCGLRVADIDGRMIILRKNGYRRLKNKGAWRRLPLHNELIRLGFLDYVSMISKSGSDMLFPDLRERGAFTSLAGLFAKTFVNVRDESVPNAKAEGKTFHSFRHSFNSTLINKISDVTRYCLMGHTTTDEGKQLDVNARVYSHHDDEALIKAVYFIPNYSEHLAPRVWS